MRNLRAVYNKAVKKNFVKQKNPFTNVYTGIDKTEKRAIDEDIIEKLYHLELSEMPILDKVRDLFVFSFCARAMSYVDVAYLKKKDIRNGYIVYRRSKTKQLMSVKVEMIMKTIIEKYQTDDNEYVF